MPDPHPPHLAEALSRFRSAADAAVEQGRRAAEDARAAGAAFDRGSQDQLARPPQRPRHDREAEPTAPELQEAAEDYRLARDLPLPWDEPPPDPSPRRRPAEDQDFSQFRIMRPLH